MEVAKTVVDAKKKKKNGGGIKTITTDNGPEFANHEYITKKTWSYCIFYRSILFLAKRMY